MILIDSSGWIEYFSNGPLASIYAKYVAQPAQVIIPTIVCYEVYKKIKMEKGESIAISIAATLQKGNIVPLTDELAMMAADYSLQYKISMADAIVYATALQERVSLVTSDRDLKELPGVIYHEKTER